MMTVKNNPKMFGWTLENGYTNSTKNQYPIRSFQAGQRTGLELVLNYNKNDFNSMCNGLQQGFTFIITLPGELPIQRQESLTIDPSVDALITIEPRDYSSSNNLINYEPSDRLCFYQSERQLRYFKVYTRNNCVLECLTNVTIMNCGCAMIYMPSMQSLNLICIFFLNLCDLFCTKLFFQLFMCRR